MTDFNLELLYSEVIMTPTEIMDLISNIANVGLGIGGLVEQHYQNQQNIDFSNAQNEIERQRQDTYQQRRVQDFVSAGFSPLASLEGGSYSPTIVTPQNNQIDVSALQNALMQSSVSSQAYEERGLKKSQQQLDKDYNDKWATIEANKLDSQAQQFYDKLKSDSDSFMASLQSQNLNEQNKLLVEAQKIKNDYEQFVYQYKMQSLQLVQNTQRDMNSLILELEKIAQTKYKNKTDRFNAINSSVRGYFDSLVGGVTSSINAASNIIPKIKSQ